MYWTAYPIIEGAEMDGTNRFTLLRSRYYDPQGVAMDIQRNGLFFASREQSSIFYMTLGHRTIQRLLKMPPGTGRPVGIAVDDHYVYWSTGYQGNARPPQIYRTNKTRINGQVKSVLRGLKDPIGIAVHKGNTTRDSKFCL